MRPLKTPISLPLFWINHMTFIRFDFIPIKRPWPSTIRDNYFLNTFTCWLAAKIYCMRVLGLREGEANDAATDYIKHIGCKECVPKLGINQCNQTTLNGLVYCTRQIGHKKHHSACANFGMIKLHQIVRWKGGNP